MTGLPDGLPGYLTAGQVARALRLSERTVRHHLDHGNLPFIQIAGRSGWRVVPAADLAAFAAKHGLPLDWASAL